MPANLPQHVDVVKLGQPIGIVGHQGPAAARSEIQEFCEYGPYATLVGLDLFDAKELAALIAPRGITHPRGTAAHEHDWLLARLLGPVEQHDLDEGANMEGWRGAVESDIGGHISFRGKRIQTLIVRALMDKAARRKGVEEFGRELAHFPAL